MPEGGEVVGETEEAPKSKRTYRKKVKRSMWSENDLQILRNNIDRPTREVEKFLETKRTLAAIGGMKHRIKHNLI